ncbi:MAG: carbohydrate kinase family protein [Treponema sp.]|nr:carbohydrate kinase family protein [Treponema sp.]
MENQSSSGIIKRHLLCVGNVSVDIKAYSAEDTSVEAYREGSIELVPGGVARGMAINLKHLGLDTAILSSVGKDIFGDYLRQELEKEKIDTTLLSTSTERRTALFSVMASPGNPAACIYCTNILREIILNDKTRRFIDDHKINTLVMDSNPEPETLKDFYELKKEKDMFVFQNATAPDIAAKSLKWAPLINLFGCNEFEASSILGEEAAPDLETADKFQKLGFRNFIITFGERGVMVRIGNETWNEPPYTPAMVVDTIGAGDAFASGFLMGFLAKKPIKRCIHYGLACAKETLLTRQTVSTILNAGFLESYPGTPENRQ